MNTISNRLRIGEKIGFGFALVSSVFLLVIWQYHSTLNNSLEDYQQLNEVYAAKNSLVLNIESGLLNARLAEKDFLMKHQSSDSLQVSKLVNKTIQLVDRLSSINVDSSGQEKLFKENLTNYLDHFTRVETAWVKKGLDENSGLQGSFRNAVHALEEMVSDTQYAELHIKILQLRRREKDYLLRGDHEYVDTALSIIQTIYEQMKSASFGADEKLKISNLLSNYKNDFLALVDQNDQIIELEKSMEIVAAEVASLVKEHVEINNNKMIELTQHINSTSAERIRSMLWLVAVAVVLGIYFATTITLRIVRPLRKMASILDNSTHTEIVETMPYQSNGRDEINAMVGSLNLLTEHRKRFINWWKSSMNETEACALLANKLATFPNDSSEFLRIKTELLNALSEKKQLLETEHQQIQKYNEEIVIQAARLDHASLPRDDIYNAAKIIRNKTALIQKALEMVLYKAA